MYIYCILCTFNTSSKVQRYVTNIVCTFVVRPLGCWVNVLGDSAIPENHGDLGVQGCYEKAESLGYTVFSVLGEHCYTSSTARDTYRKYGPSIRIGHDKDCGGGVHAQVYEIENGNLLYK